MTFQATSGPRRSRRSPHWVALVLCGALAACQAADRTDGLGGGGHDALDSLPLFEQGGERMLPAVDFINSIGVVTHLRYTSTPYVNDYASLIRPRLLELGVRHLREEAAASPDNVIAHYRELISHGIDFSMVCDPRMTTPEGALALMRKIGGGIGYIEGPNEFDNNRSNNAWVPEVLDYVRRLHTVMRADPVTRAVPILSPSFLKETTPSLIGNISAFIDYGNIHPYPFPGSPMFARRVQHMVAEFSGVYGGKPFVATETGYHTGGPNSDRPVSETLQGKYMPRLFLENFNAGIVRSYSYELLDEGNDPDNREDHFGLLRTDGSRKPAFTVISNMISLLQDSQRPVHSRSLNYSFTSASDSVHHTLLQKSDGSVSMVFWMEVSSTDAPRNVAATVTLASPVARVRVYHPAQSVDPIATFTNTSHFDLQVLDSPVVVALTP